MPRGRIWKVMCKSCQTHLYNCTFIWIELNLITHTHTMIFTYRPISRRKRNDNRCNKTCEPTRSDSKIGQGNLIKCYVHRIETDHTSGNCTCPKCNATFCFKREVKGRPAHKLIIDRVRIVRAKHGDC